MPLKKQVVAIDFGSGIDTNASPDVVVPGKLLMCQNASLKKGGAISKRFGGASLSTTANIKGTTGATNTILQGLALFPQGEQLLMPARTTPQHTDTSGEVSLMAYSDRQSRWMNKGGVLSAIIKSTVINNGGAVAYQRLDSAIISSTQCVVASLSTASAIVMIHDLVTKTNIAVGSLAWTKVKVIAFGGNFYIFGYAAAPNLYCLRVSPSTPRIDIALAQLVVTDANVFYDICTTPTYIYLAYNKDAATAINIKSYTSAIITGTLGVAPTPQASNSVGEAASNCIAIAAHVASGITEQVQIVYQNGTQGLRSAAYDGATPGSLAGVGGTFTIEAFGGGLVAYQVSISTDPLTNSRVLWQLSASSYHDIDSKINGAMVSRSALISGPTGLFLGALLMSRIFRLPYATTNLDDPHYVLLCYNSTIQPTYFLANISSGLLTWIAGRIDTVTTGGNLQSSLISVDTSLTTQARLAIFSEIDFNNTLYTGVSTLNIDFDKDSSFQTVEVNNSVFITGGQLTQYDGEYPSAVGLDLFPQDLAAVDSAGGGLTVGGTYQWAVCYEWQDKNGDVHRSAPSIPAGLTMSAANQTVTITYPNLRLTNKGRSGGTVPGLKIVVYRTETLGTTFYNCSGSLSPNNDFGSNYGTFVDTMSDATLVGQAILYTTGDVLENEPPPPCNVIGIFKDRVFLGDLDVKDTVRYSKQLIPGDPLEFAAEFQFNLPSVGGDCTGIRQFVDKLLFFKKERIYYIIGDGPNDTGEGGNFSDPTLVNATIGCSDPKSIVESTDGIIFQGYRGFYLLDQSLQLTFIGAPVDYYNTLRVSSAVVVPAENQIRWQTRNASGATIVYDYNLKQWFTFTGQAGRCATLWQQTYVRLESTDLPVIQDATFRDGTNVIPLRIKTGWFSFAQVGGFQRVYRAIILGRFKSAHLLTVKISYDHNPTIVDTKTFDPAASGLNISAFSDAAYYENAAYGGGTDMYEFRIHIPRQKCQSIQLTIEDSSQSGTYESVQITSVAFEIGIKDGVQRMKAEASL